MTGRDVLHPMGWDAFGLPAENAALERGVNPRDWTLDNISKMKDQLKSMGSEFDWDKEFMTCSPSFYKHTQRIFLKLYERGLAYQSEAMVNWDPVDKTVLANEQVDANGNSWRSGAKVEKIMLKQWFFRITAFQDDLLEGIESLLEKGTWPERVLTQQKHWLGKSEGAKIRFVIAGEGVEQKKVEVFTTRPDTLFGAQFLALALNHPLVQQIAERDGDLRSFLANAADLPPESKAGCRLRGVYATNPLKKANGGVSEDLPVFAAPYVLSDYGEGAVMGVPGHDNRDWAFWAQHGNGSKPKVVVRAAIETANIETQSDIRLQYGAYTGHGILTDMCGDYAGLDSVEAGRKIVGELFGSGDADVAQNWRLRDWLISRQRYWGTPIPIIHCNSCGAVPIPDEQLPVELPDLSGVPPGTTGNPLEHIQSYVNAKCPTCHGPARRDTDTMDTFVDSSWYYMRFPDAKNETEPFSLESARRSLPVDIYIGGVEHAILHLLYARFIYKFLNSEGLIPYNQTMDQGSIEPFRQVISQGMVHGKTYSDPSSGRFLHPSEVSFDEKGSPVMTATGAKPNISFEKMSKSKHNGVDPSTIIAKYGADAVRAHVLFSAPVSEVLEWNEQKIVGIQRWFNKITRIVDESISRPPPSTYNGFNPLILTLPPSLSALKEPEIKLLLTLNTTINSITRTFDTNPYALNTTISDLIKLTNHLTTYAPSSDPLHLFPHSLSLLLRLLSPIAPQFTQTLWTKLLSHWTSSLTIMPATTTQIPSLISQTPFPTALLTPSQETQLLTHHRQTFLCTVQINGKVRFSTEIPISSPPSSSDNTKISSSAAAAAAAVEEEEYITHHLLETQQGKIWLQERNDLQKKKKIIVVGGGKLVNFVF